MTRNVVDNQPHTSLDEILRDVSVCSPEVHALGGMNETHQEMKPGLEELVRNPELFSIISLCMRKQALERLDELCKSSEVPPEVWRVRSHYACSSQLARRSPAKPTIAWVGRHLQVKLVLVY